MWRRDNAHRDLEDKGLWFDSGEELFFFYSLVLARTIIRLLIFKERKNLFSLLMVNLHTTRI